MKCLAEDGSKTLIIVIDPLSKQGVVHNKLNEKNNCSYWYAKQSKLSLPLSLSLSLSFLSLSPSLPPSFFSISHAITLAVH